MDGSSTCTCNAGFSQQGSGSSLVCTTCTEGFFSSQNDTSCTPCPFGSSSSVSSSTCTCNEGYEWNGLTGLALQCTACAKGSVQGLPNKTFCIKCSAGYIQPSARGTSCSVCGSGTFSNLGLGIDGSSSCTPCPTGSSTNGASGQSTCTCNAGYRWNGLTGLGLVCTPCPLGSYNTDGGPTCTECLPGSYQPVTGKTTCLSWIASSFDDAQAAFCVTCSVGSFCSGGAVNKPCEPGYYSELGASNCTICPQGYFCPGSSNKIACTPGLYQAALGQSMCKPCPISSSSFLGSSTCTCTSGYISSGSGDDLVCTPRSPPSPPYPPPPSPPPPSPPPPFPPYTQADFPNALMVNITIDGPDFNILSSSGNLSGYEATLCKDILLYCSVSIGGAGSSLNSNLGCIPIGSVPGSIVTRLVVYAASPELLAATAPFINNFAVNPMSVLKAMAFSTSYNVRNASSVVIQSPPPPSPPPSPNPPVPPAAPPPPAVPVGVSGLSGAFLIILLAVFAVNVFLFVRARAMASSIKKDLMAPALKPPRMDSKRFQVSQLPDIISAHHIGMPPVLASAPMRLLLIESVMNWPSLKVSNSLLQLLLTCFLRGPRTLKDNEAHCDDELQEGLLHELQLGEHWLVILALVPCPPPLSSALLLVPAAGAVSLYASLEIVK